MILCPSFTTTTSKAFTLTKNSFLHFGQNTSWWNKIVSFRSFVRVLLPQSGQATHFVSGLLSIVPSPLYSFPSNSHLLPCFQNIRRCSSGETLARILKCRHQLSLPKAKLPVKTSGRLTNGIFLPVGHHRKFRIRRKFCHGGHQ